MAREGGEYFGELLRELRVKKGCGLRDFAKKISMQPSNLSFIENGRAHPPRDPEMLLRIAGALGLKKGDAQWGDFFDLAAKDTQRLPADLAKDKNIREYIPMMMRTISNERLSTKEIKQLIEKIRTFRHDNP
ncbi:MAG: helix-turn-helix transcriptional regulator [Elusimicrobia bacterium]|nr:helix-turn-helix transcriptional regulator [Elusimicrobiota bacterium]